MSNSDTGKIFVVAIIFLLIGGVGAYLIFPKEVTTGFDQEDINSAISDATASLNQQLADLQVQLEYALRNQTDAPSNGDTIIVDTAGAYLIDDLFLEVPKSRDLSYREIRLFDGKIYLDGNSYQANEVFSIINATLKANEKDFKGTPYLTFSEGSLLYRILLDSKLNVSKIGIDGETLKFDFLDKGLEILNWENNRIILLSGGSHILTEKQSVTIEGKEVIFESSTEDYAYVSVDGSLPTKVAEGQTRTINGLQVRILTLFYNTLGTSQVELRAGTKVEIEIFDKDEYEEDSQWEWVIDSSSNTIGLKLSENYRDIDSEFKPLSQKEGICLPNNYVCVKYDGLMDTTTERYTFDIENQNWIVARATAGEFVSGFNDYNRIYISRTNGTILDRLTNGIELTNVELGNTNSILMTNGTHITIEDFNVNLNLNSTSIDEEDYDQMTNYGILVRNTKSALADEFFTIEVPREIISGSLTVKDITYKESTSNSSTS